MAYKLKHKQYTISSAKQPHYYYNNDNIVLNINSCFPKKGNFQKFIASIKEINELTDKVNLCNLASYCYKVGIKYASQETLDFVKEIVNYIKKDTNLKITQNNILSYGEIDMKPFDSLVSFDRQHDIIYTNSVLLDCLDIMGFASNQLYDIVDLTKDLKVVIPEDLICDLPIASKINNGCYEMIKEIICSQDM